MLGGIAIAAYATRDLDAQDVGDRRGAVAAGAAGARRRRPLALRHARAGPGVRRHRHAAWWARPSTRWAVCFEAAGRAADRADARQAVGRGPGRRRLAVRAEVGRLPHAGVSRRRRGLPAEPRFAPDGPLLPRAGGAAARRAAAARGPRRRDRDRGRRTASTSRRCCCAFTRRRRASPCWRARSRRRSSRGTCSPRATRICCRSRWSSAAAGWRRRWPARARPST